MNRALSLLGVFIVARMLMLSGRQLEFSAWTPIAYFWQDLLAAMALALLFIVIRWKWIGLVLYGFVVFYVALNVPVVRAFSTPLTWRMLRAAGGPLTDSVLYYANVSNLIAILIVLMTGASLPLLLSHVRPIRDVRSCFLVIIAVATVIAAGPFAVRRVETRGLERSAVLVLGGFESDHLDRGDVATRDPFEWRRSTSIKQVKAPLEDLSELRGAAADRNVVLILLESTAAQYLESPIAGIHPMPHFQMLSENGIRFSSAYAVYPESIKGLFSVLLSRYPAIDTESESYSGVATPSLAEILARHRYRSGLFHSGRFMYLGMEAVIHQRGFEILEDAGEIGGQHESSFGVDEYSTVNRCLNWIDSIGNQRFFLTYLPIAGHHPYESMGEGPFPNDTELNRYLNALHYSDAALGSLIEGLRERGLYEKTLFVVLGDHGEAFGQHEGNFGHPFNLFDENIRVPFVIAAPGLIDSAQTVRRPLSLVDAAPTVLDLLGVQGHPEFQGRSGLDAESRMALFYTDYSMTLLGLRDGCWKYIYDAGSGRSRLFDLCIDPGETRDVSAKYAARVAAYRDHLVNWSAAQRTLIVHQISKE